MNIEKRCRSICEIINDEYTDVTIVFKFYEIDPNGYYVITFDYDIIDKIDSIEFTFYKDSLKSMDIIYNKLNDFVKDMILNHYLTD